jgi:hypothetical protein
VALQTDGYSAYGSLAKERDDLTLVGCWAHVRRGVHDAGLAKPSGIRSAASCHGDHTQKDFATRNYLKDLFAHLPAAKITQTQQFTPRAWAKAKTEETIAQPA